MSRWGIVDYIGVAFTVALVNTIYLITWGEVFSHNTLRFLILTFFKDISDFSMALCSWLLFIVVIILALIFKLGRIVWLKRMGH